MNAIWLIDDAPTSYTILKEGLPKNLGKVWHFSTFDDACWGIQTARTKPLWQPAIVFLDYYLDNGHTGKELLPMLQEAFPQVCIIGFSSNPHRNQEYIDLGAKTALTKSPDTVRSLQRLFPTIDALRSFART